MSFKELDPEPPLMVFLVTLFIFLMSINIRGCANAELQIRARACSEVKGYLTSENECVAKPKIIVGAQ